MRPPEGFFTRFVLCCLLCFGTLNGYTFLSSRSWVSISLVLHGDDVPIYSLILARILQTHGMLVPGFVGAVGDI